MEANRDSRISFRRARLKRTRKRDRPTEGQSKTDSERQKRRRGGGGGAAAARAPCGAAARPPALPQSSRQAPMRHVDVTPRRGRGRGGSEVMGEGGRGGKEERGKGEAEIE